MPSNFVLFGPAHLFVLGLTAVSVAVLGALGRARPDWLGPIRRALGVALAATAAAWYTYLASQGAVRIPETLPLDLCDVMLWVAVVAALTLNRTAVEMAYFVGVGGSAMALLMPDVRAPVTSWPMIAFLLTHALVVATPLVLVASGSARPRAGSVRRVFLILNVYAAALAAFNAMFGTNYMYLCRKPSHPSLLDYFGPWPLYIASADLFAILVFSVLWLPFRNAPVRR